MKLVLKTAALAAVASLALAGNAFAAGKCVNAGGTADMLTEDLARFMANAALNNQMKAQGLKPAGPVKMVCKSGYPVNCTARQRACK